MLSNNKGCKQHAYNKGLALEKIAANYLQKKGFTILEHNVRGQYGEIDLICTSNNELVFVEVRYRQNSQFGTPEETINYAKQQKILLTALEYLANNNWTVNLPCRIDVIAISGNIPKVKIKWIQNAISVQ